jgi:hypothetical protein
MNAVQLVGSEVRHLRNETTGDSLAVIAARGMIFSAWSASPEEKQALAAGKSVWVVMRGNMVPEFLLTVGDRNQVVPPEIIKRARHNDALLNTELGQKIVARHRRTEWLTEAIAWIYCAALAAACLVSAWWLWRFAGSWLIQWVMNDPL